jgi:hypothetical protein
MVIHIYIWTSRSQKNLLFESLFNSLISPLKPSFRSLSFLYCSSSPLSRSPSFEDLVEVVTFFVVRIYRKRSRKYRRVVSLLRSSSKEVKRAVVVKCYANQRVRRALREIEDAYKEMLKEIVEYALEHSASQSTLHEVFYERFRRRFPRPPRGSSRELTETPLEEPSPSGNSRRGGGVR